MALTARIVGPGEAEDIVQETFTRAWIAAPAWKPTGADRPSYAAWLSRVAVNLAIDRTRRPRPIASDTVPDVPDATPNAEAAMLRDERIALLNVAIARLPSRQRVALSLTYDAELTNAEAASAMETSVGAFELLLVRARRALRTAMRVEATE